MRKAEAPRLGPLAPYAFPAQLRDDDPILIRASELLIKEPGALSLRTGLEIPLNISLSGLVKGRLILPVGPEESIVTVRFRAKRIQ